MYTLNNEILSVDFDTMENNLSTRFEHLCYVSQIHLGKHTFLSGEMTKAGPGTQGKGLIHGWVPANDTDENIIGVGTIRLNNEKYNIRKNYACDFLNCHISKLSETTLLAEVILEGSYHLSRKYSLNEATLTIDTAIENIGQKVLKASEYCHNFFMFDDYQIGPAYRIEFSSAKNLSIVRGAVLLDDEGYNPVCFEPKLGTIALSYDKTETECVVIANTATGTSVEITNNFIPESCYHWISPWSICPEAYKTINLKPEESLHFSRQYTFSSLVFSC